MRYLTILCMSLSLALPAQDSPPIQDILDQADRQRHAGWIALGAGTLGALAVAATGHMDSPRETAIVCVVFAVGGTITLGLRASANAKERRAIRKLAIH